MKQSHVLILVFIFAVCQTHQTWGRYYRNVTARSCLDYFKRGEKTNGYYHIVISSLVQTVYCDMESEPGFAWTLVESFALQNNAMPQFSKRALIEDFPVRPEAPNWNLYRMSLSQMNHLKERSTHWRVTCDFQAKPVDLYRDYAVARFKDSNVMTFKSSTCFLMEYINVRGNHCAECTASWQVSPSSYAINFPSSTTSCEFKPGAATPHERNFGYYSHTSNKFRCTSSADATTNFWFGGYF